MTTTDHFRRVAPMYDRMAPELDGDSLFDLLDLRSAGRVLDVGGGTGRVAVALDDPSHEVVVLDKSSAMLLEARDKRLPAIQSLAERLPYPDGAFDRVLAVDAFHHFSNQRQAVGEMLRVLRPGGRLVVEEPNIERFSVRIGTWMEKLFMWDSHFLSPSQLRRLFEHGGVTVRLRRDRTTVWTVVDKPA